MTWWEWALLVWVLASVPTALLVSGALGGPRRRPQRHRSRPAASERAEELGEVATSRVIRGRLIRG